MEANAGWAAQCGKVGSVAECLVVDAKGTMQNCGGKCRSAEEFTSAQQFPEEEEQCMTQGVVVHAPALDAA